MVGEESYLRDLLSPKLPAGYNELSFTEKIDWHLDNHLPALVEWTSQWVATQSRNQWDVALRFSRYEDFHRDQTAFFAELLDFFGVSAVDVKSLTGESLRTNGVHYRRGEVDEWRRIFSAEQATRATNAIPEELCQYFGWSR